MLKFCIWWILLGHGIMLATVLLLVGILVLNERNEELEKFSELFSKETISALYSIGIRGAALTAAELLLISAAWPYSAAKMIYCYRKATNETESQKK